MILDRFRRTKVDEARARALRERIAEVPYWFHSLDLGDGVVTPGQKPLATLEAELDAFDLPSMDGKTVLDIGAWDGFFSFAAERRGARRVVALDHYVWSLDFDAWLRYYEECKAAGVPRSPFEEVEVVWQPERLPGKRGFDIAHEALDSDVEVVVDDFATMDPGLLGTFDVVLFLGVLYHLRDPFGVIQNLRRVTEGVAVIESDAIAVGGHPTRALAEFYPGTELNEDPSNWWSPTLPAIGGMCRAAGFSDVVMKCEVPQPSEGEVTHFRAVVHAHP